MTTRGCSGTCPPFRSSSRPLGRDYRSGMNRMACRGSILTPCHWPRWRCNLGRGGIILCPGCCVKQNAPPVRTGRMRGDHNRHLVYWSSAYLDFVRPVPRLCEPRPKSHSPAPGIHPSLKAKAPGASLQPGAGQSYYPVVPASDQFAPSCCLARTAAGKSPAANRIAP